MMSRLTYAIGLFALLLQFTAAFAADRQRSPIETVELLHTALRNADPKAVDSLLHEEYHGVSLQGPSDHRHVYVETRAKAIDDVAHLKPNEWDVRILSTTTQIDPKGMAHVWARYVFYFKGKPNHCGHESYDLYQSARGWRVVSFADTDNPLNGKEVDQVCPAD